MIVCTWSSERVHAFMMRACTYSLAERDVCARMRPQVNGDFRGTPRFAVCVLSLAHICCTRICAHTPMRLAGYFAVPRVGIVVFSSLQIRGGDKLAATVENYEPGK